MNIEINSKQELYDYLNNFDFESVKDYTLSSVYFLIKDGSKTQPIYFMKFEDFWLETICALTKFPLKDTEVANYVRSIYEEDSFDDAYEFEKPMQKDNWHYSIENFQCWPFLSDHITIIDVFSDKKCLEWLLNCRNN